MLPVFVLTIFVVIGVFSILTAFVAGYAAGLVPVVVASSAVHSGAVGNELEVSWVWAPLVVVAQLLYHLIELIELCN